MRHKHALMSSSPAPENIAINELPICGYVRVKRTVKFEVTRVHHLQGVSHTEIQASMIATEKWGVLIHLRH